MEKPDNWKTGWAPAMHRYRNSHTCLPTLETRIRRTFAVILMCLALVNAAAVIAHAQATSTQSEAGEQGGVAPVQGTAPASSDQGSEATPDRVVSGSGNAGQVPVVPNFFDPNTNSLKPDLNRVPRLRFLTTTDFPPFNFVDRRKRLSGFHVDLARAICAELDIMRRCQMQALPWDELGPAIEKGEAEALIAGHAITAETRAKYDFTMVYLRIPARFAVRTEAPVDEPVFVGLFKKVTGVVEGSAHQKYFEEAFSQRQAKTYPSRATMLEGLKNGEVDAVFSDAVSIGFWLASETAGGCCAFAGGPYLSEKHFGSGLAIAVPKGRQDLVDALNYALGRINDDGKFSELYLRYFPLGLF